MSQDLKWGMGLVALVVAALAVVIAAPQLDQGLTPEQQTCTKERLQSPDCRVEL